MVARNEIDASKYIAPKNPASIKIKTGILDATGATAQGVIASANANKQFLLLGLVFSNTHASQTATTKTVSDVTDIFPDVILAPGEKFVILSPDMQTPLATTADSEGLKVAAVGPSGGTVEYHALYREVHL